MRYERLTIAALKARKKLTDFERKYEQGRNPRLPVEESQEKIHSDLLTQVRLASETKGTQLGLMERIERQSSENTKPNAPDKTHLGLLGIDRSLFD